MLLTRGARCSGSCRWKTPSTSRRPTCAGAGASSQPLTPLDSAQSRKRSSPPARLYRTKRVRSIASVPTAAAARPRATAPRGVERADGEDMFTADPFLTRAEAPRSDENAARKCHRYQPVRDVHGLADLQIAGNAAQHV